MQKSSDELDEKSIVKPKTLSRDEVITKLEEIIQTIVEDISQNKPPSLKYNCRNSWKNTRFNSAVGIEMIDDVNQTEHRFSSMASIGKFAATLRVMAFCYKLLQQDTYATKRDIYYSDVPFFGNQNVVDSIIDNIACMLKVPRHCLHVLAASKAIDRLDIHSDAKFVLVVEKEASFQRLMDDNVLHRLHPCIVITVSTSTASSLERIPNKTKGKGFPDVNTRMMIRRLWYTLQIPILALVDADPHGIEILSVYKFGSKALSFDAQSLTVPVLKWLGVLPSDIIRLSIPRDQLIPLTERDRYKARELLDRPYIQSHEVWKKEIETMLSQGFKAEIQALSSISFNFLSETYLPVKIKHGRWI
ncbi:Meiotic recombination protein SPO11 [Stylophora pistillata]|uniref:DNA topoisomerase (ATP-hydrolyzing) n=1 Tax=Stylophora pistillata TaxID=50429 RepID=A0A2B4SSC1_STYPI|nr:Meiotic recombination protein SPO11 [Stylophora pistillata]